MSLGGILVNTVGDGAFRMAHSVLVMMYEHCPDETTHHEAIFLVSSLSVPLDISNQISTVGSCDSAAIFKID